MATTSANRSAPVAVVGAGIGGLVAARELRRNGYPVVVLEAGPKVAGLAASHRDADGFSYDTGAHFITNRLAAAIGVGAQCRTVRHYGETVWLGGRSYGYPFGLLRRPRYFLPAVRARAGARRSSAPTTAADWFRAQYGTALADEIALPLLEAWSGAPADLLAASVGSKLPGGIGETMLLKAAAKLTRRAVAIGYCGAKPQSAQVWHVYPDRGVVTLCEHLAEELADSIRLESPVERIFVDSGRAVGVRAGGCDLDVAAVVSTAPINVLPKLVDGTDVLDRYRSFRFRPMIFVNLKLEGRGLLSDVVVWTPQSDLPFFRLTEGPQSMPWLAPEGKTTVTVDIGAAVGDEHWEMDDEVVTALCVEHIASLIPDVRRRFLGSHVVKTPIAYPIFLAEYEEARRALEHSTGVTDLLSVGRNGEFAHILMEDVYWRTLARVRTWMRQPSQPMVSVR